MHLRPICFIAALLVSGTHSSAAQDKELLKAGDRVRITLDETLRPGSRVINAKRITGTVVQVSAEGVILRKARADSATLIQIPHHKIAEVELSRGNMPMMRSVRLGATRGFIGGTAAALFVAAYPVWLASKDRVATRVYDHDTPEAMLMRWGIRGALAGTVFGGFLGSLSTEQWSDLPITRASVVPIKNGVAVSLRMSLQL